MPREGVCRRSEDYGALAPLYDQALGDAAYPKIISAFEQARRRHGIGFDVAADVGCGTGRFLKHLAQFATRVYGVDRSWGMLDMARPRAARVGAKLLRQDLRALRLPEAADLITCNFDTINYLLHGFELRAAFRSFARNLRPGGALIFDFIPRLTGQRAAKNMTQAAELRGASSRWHHRIETARGRSLTRIDLIRRSLSGDVRCWFETHAQQWWRPSEITCMLRDVGFEILSVCPMTPGRTHCWLQVVARRR